MHVTMSLWKYSASLLVSGCYEAATPCFNTESPRMVKRTYLQTVHHFQVECTQVIWAETSNDQTPLSWNTKTAFLILISLYLLSASVQNDQDILIFSNFQKLWAKYFQNNKLYGLCPQIAIDITRDNNYIHFKCSVYTEPLWWMHL